MLALSRLLLFLSELCSDASEWLATTHRWREIRSQRRPPPASEFYPPDVSDGPFHLPPDVDHPRRKRRSF